MSDARVERYAAMWTTDLRRYGVVQFDPLNREQSLVFDLEAWAPMTMDDDPEVIARVVQKMLAAGARRLTPEEVKPK